MKRGEVNKRFNTKDPPRDFHFNVEKDQNDQTMAVHFQTITNKR